MSVSRLGVWIEDFPVRTMIILTVTVGLFRFSGLFLYQTDLGPDEAQYWFWSLTLDWGYYSKPPMIAWVIGLPTRLFGDVEWAVRALSPVFISASAYCLFAATRLMFGDRAGLWVGALWLTLPVIFLGGTIISTDGPLLFFWSLGLYALIAATHARPEDRSRWAVLLGLAMGLGLLSKYAMIYFFLGLGLATILVPSVRAVTLSRSGILALVLAGLIFTPNILWNFANGLQTLGHTADNANWSGGLGHPDELLDFFSAQFGVFGPILFAALIVGLVRPRWWRGAYRERLVLLLCFTVPALVLISGQAFLSRAHANWALTAYPAATIVVVAVALNVWERASVLWASLGIHMAVGLVFSAALLQPTIADALSLSNAIKRLRGWDQSAEQIVAMAQTVGANGIIADERELAAHLVWELRDAELPVYAMDLNGRLDHTYEYARPIPDNPGAVFLLATQRAPHPCHEASLDELSAEGTSFVDLKSSRRGVPERTIDLFSGRLASSPCGAVAPTQ